MEEIDFFSFPEAAQNYFLENNITEWTNFLKKAEFTNSKGCYYLYQDLLVKDNMDAEQCNSLAMDIILLMRRNYLLAFRFNSDTDIHPATGLPKIHFIFAKELEKLTQSDRDSFQILYDSPDFADIHAN